MFAASVCRPNTAFSCERRINEGEREALANRIGTKPLAELLMDKAMEAMLRKRGAIS